MLALTRFLGDCLQLLELPRGNLPKRWARVAPALAGALSCGNPPGGRWARNSRKSTGLVTQSSAPASSPATMSSVRDRADKRNEVGKLTRATFPGAGGKISSPLNCGMTQSRRATSGGLSQRICKAPFPSETA